MSGYILAIDYGTSYTAAAITDPSGRPESLHIDGDRRMPSVVFLTEDGVLVAGRSAESQIGLDPRRAARTPKREVGVVDSLRLGDDDVPVVDVIAAVLTKVATEARRHYDGAEPASVILTHPASWREGRISVLLAAAKAAELPDPTLVPEPVGAALYYADEQVPVGGYVAVYDLGGGTFDTAVLLRTDEGFELAGPTGGHPTVGGEGFDDRLYDYLLEHLQARHPEVAARLGAVGGDAGSAATFRTDVRLAKETLSDYVDSRVYTKPENVDLTVTRAEFERLLKQDIDSTIDELVATVERANLGLDDLTAVYLAGGSSRIPLVAETIQRRLSRRPTTYGDPKLVISLGAISAARILDSDPITSVAALVHKTSTLAEKAGLPEAARFLQGEAERPESTSTTMIVVGETKRGKSSLVNALVDRPGLLPVDVDVATSVHLEIRAAATPEAVVVDQEGGRTPIDPAAIGQYASVAGNPHNIRWTAAVEVGLPHPLLERGLTVIDTPGVGGLHAGHNEITLAALRLADVLLFVTDASSPITAPEAQFLGVASERLDTVLFAVTKTDLFRGHEKIVADNQRLIRQHAPRFANAPTFSVSSVLKAQAVGASAAGDLELAQELADLSGFLALERFLRDDLLGRSEELRMVNLLRAASTTIKRILAVEDIRRRSAEGDRTLTDELAAERARYTQLASSMAQWGPDLDKAMGELRAATAARVAAATADLTSRYEARALAGEEPTALLEDLSNAVRGRWTDIHHLVRAGVTQALVTTCTGLRDAGIELAGEDTGISRRPRQLDLDAVTAEANALLQRAVAQAGVSGTRPTWTEAWQDMSTATKAVGVATTLLVFWPALPLIWAWKKWTMPGKEQPPPQDRAQAAAQAVRTAMTQSEARLNEELDSLFMTITGHLHQLIGERIEQRRREMDEALEAHHQRATASADERRRDAQEGQANMAAAARLLARVDALRDELTAGLAPSGSA